MVSSIARLGKLAGYNWPTDCFNRLLDCSQQAFGRAWALPSPPLAAPLHAVDSQTHIVGNKKNSAGEGCKMGNHLYNDFLTWPVKSGKAHVVLVVLVATPLMLTPQTIFVVNSLTLRLMLCA